MCSHMGVIMTKYDKYNLAALYLLFALQCLPCPAKEYHIDSQKQFDALSRTAFLAGDSILFKRGVRFNGMFAPLRNGTEEAPIRIEVYGSGEGPRINSYGKHLAGVFLQDPSYWEVNGLEIANTDGTDKACFRKEELPLTRFSKTIYSSSRDRGHGASAPTGLARHFTTISTSTFRPTSRTPTP